MSSVKAPDAWAFSAPDEEISKAQDARMHMPFDSFDLLNIVSDILMCLKSLKLVYCINDTISEVFGQ